MTNEITHGRHYILDTAGTCTLPCGIYNYIFKQLGNPWKRTHPFATGCLSDKLLAEPYNTQCTGFDVVEIII